MERSKNYDMKIVKKIYLNYKRRYNSLLDPRTQRLTVMLSAQELQAFIDYCIARGTDRSEQGRIMILESMAAENSGLNDEADLGKESESTNKSWQLADAWFDRFIYYSRRYKRLVSFLKENNINVPEMLVKRCTPQMHYRFGRKDD